MVATRTRVLWLTLGVLACSSNDATTRELRDFTDAEGRVCRATLEKANPNAPVLSASITCDGAGRECSSESAPCFQLDVARDTFAISNCPGCCHGTASSYFKADCSALACEVDADCVYASASCTDGVCFCPDGSCD